MQKMLWALALYMLLFITACAEKQSVLLKEDSVTLTNWKKGKEFLLAERFELAREYFLYALASTKTEETRQLIINDLEAVNLMIKTQW